LLYGHQILLIELLSVAFHSHCLLHDTGIIHTLYYMGSCISANSMLVLTCVLHLTWWWKWQCCSV